MNGLASLARQALVGRVRPALLAVALVGLGELAYQHSAHLIAVVPYLLLLACPLMHLFMMHGHGHGHDGQDHAAASETAKPPASRDAGDA